MLTICVISSMYNYTSLGFAPVAAPTTRDALIHLRPQLEWDPQFITADGQAAVAFPWNCFLNLSIVLLPQAWRNLRLLETVWCLILMFNRKKSQGTIEWIPFKHTEVNFYVIQLPSFINKTAYRAGSIHRIKT